MPLKVLHLSTYAGGGGAARAASNVNKALQSAGVDSRMLTAHGHRFKLARAADRALWNLQRSPVNTWRSPARFGSLSAKTINESEADVVILHWVTDGFLSIEEIGRIEKPIVMSMYDMWPFCGTEHYGVDSPNARWITGYTRENRPTGESGFDLDRDTWIRKLRNWHNFHMIPASSWLEAATRNSALCSKWPTTRIPHPVDELTFRPISRTEAKMRLGIDSSRPTIGFVASAGVHDERKGFDLLKEALPQVLDQVSSAQLVVVGPLPASPNESVGLETHFTGPLTNQATLVRAYNAMDVLVVPSREDNMPLTAMEAQMCGTPVVAFAVGGLVDLVDNDKSGSLWQLGDTQGLAAGLVKVLRERDANTLDPNAVRQRAMRLWGFEVISTRYLEVLQRVTQAG